jgi:deazaflavin-dependent oxidoreductase (nitroreductase family)
MPSELFLKSMNTFHRSLMKVSGGKLGWTAGKMPVLELTTTGRKSGQPRSVMLTTPWQNGDTMAIVASAGGNDEHPAWFLNLRDEPQVTVRTEEGPKQMTARIADGEEYTRLWGEIVARYKNYGGYQTKTERKIPVVLLEPTG